MVSCGVRIPRSFENKKIKSWKGGASLGQPKADRADPECSLLRVRVWILTRGWPGPSPSGPCCTNLQSSTRSLACASLAGKGEEIFGDIRDALRCKSDPGGPLFRGTIMRDRHREKLFVALPACNDEKRRVIHARILCVIHRGTSDFRGETTLLFDVESDPFSLEPCREWPQPGIRGTSGRRIWKGTLADTSGGFSGRTAPLTTGRRRLTLLHAFVKEDKKLTTFTFPRGTYFFFLTVELEAR